MIKEQAAAAVHKKATQDDLASYKGLCAHSIGSCIHLEVSHTQIWWRELATKGRCFFIY